VFDVVVIYFLLNREACGVGMTTYMKIRDEIGFLEFFPETTWRVMHDRQATQVPDPVSG